MGYRQFWLTSKTKVENIWEKQWENYVCFASMEFQNDFQHWNVQLVNPIVAHKYKSLLHQLNKYFVFNWDTMSADEAKAFYDKTTFSGEYEKNNDHVAFLITWKDSSFFNNTTLRLFFLTLLRIGQETPWILDHWTVEKGFEDLCLWSAKCTHNPKFRKLRGPFTDNNSGHLITCHSDITRYPSIETCIMYLCANTNASIHTCTHNILKGNRNND